LQAVICLFFSLSVSAFAEDPAAAQPVAAPEATAAQPATDPAAQAAAPAATDPNAAAQPAAAADAAAAQPAQPAEQAAQAPAEQAAKDPKNDKAGSYGVGSFTEEEYFDFQSQDTFMDVGDALKSKQYVRRAILSTVIKNTTQMKVGKWYMNHLIGFNAVLQKTPVYSKYVTGVQAISAGYVSANGHGGEGGIELSAVSNLYAGYRYFYRPEKLLMWFTFGAGLGKALGFLALGEGPPESRLYNGSTMLFYTGASMMLPLVDVCFKAEIRMNFFSFDRLSLTAGVGALIFL
jgi:hypothetical protein